MEKDKGDMMHSTLLEKHGLKNFIAGSEYNFRYKEIGNEIIDEVSRALSQMNVQPSEIYSGSQCHGSNIAYATGTSGEPFVFGRQFEDTDGLITDKEGVALLIKFADCTPIILFDPETKVHASVHSGWRGTVQQISVRAINKMIEEFDVKNEDIVAFVGPSIDMENYEVGPEVYEAFENFKDRDSFFKPYGEKYLMSMTDANLSILKKAGIKEENIEVFRDSTFTDERLHSSRQEGSSYQLNGIITMLESE